MNIDDIEKFSKNINGKILFNYELKKTNWFNIGGKAKIYFRPESLTELIEFLKLYKNRGKLFIIGAGSNSIFKDGLFNGVIIKLGKKFTNISHLNQNTFVAGSGVSDKQVSEFAFENSIGGFEFLSCIPGTVGGGIRMNSGCFDREFKDILISVQAIDKFGKVITIQSNKIEFSYRSCDLPKDIIFLSATFEGHKIDKKKISDKIKKFADRKEKSQPSRIKTCGSTFKNPINQTNKKAWELIKESKCENLKIGGASISKKHSNFFINNDFATSKDMEDLIHKVKEKVFENTGIKLELELQIIGNKK